MRKIKLLLLLLFCTTGIFAQKYEANWESLKEHGYPQWFRDAKLGIFIHWGIPSVPSYASNEGYSEWFLRGLITGDKNRKDFQNRVYGENFSYRDYAKLFKAELFDADEWSRIFKSAGAKYVLFVAKHHDGYAMWPSKYSPNWNSVDNGPGVNFVDEIAKSTRKNGMKLGLYYSLPEWNNELHRWDTDPHREIGPYVEKHMIPQFKELIGKYKPSLVFTDGEWWNTAKEWHAAELIAWYYNLVGQDAIVNNRWGHGSNIGFLTPEYSAGISSTDRPWAQCRGVGRSFALNRQEPLTNYMKPKELIDLFITAVANGGGLTLNVGPKSDGQIPMIQQLRLKQLGDWIKKNEEAIYASTAYPTKQGEFKKVYLKRTDKTIDFNWVRNSPGEPISVDHFNAQWNGFIQAPASETYKFEVKVEDKIRVWIDGQLVVNKWGKSKKISDGNNNESSNNIAVKNGEITLKKNKKYAIKVEFEEHTHGAAAHLYWSSKSVTKEVVPTSALFTSKNRKTGDGLNAIYSSDKQWLAYTQNNGNLYAIALEWPDEKIELDLKLKSKPKVSLIGYEGKLDYSYNNGKLIINTSNIPYSKMPSHYAWTFKIEE